jgi:hypothetical protein
MDMTKTTRQKITLTTVSLLATFALSAQAGPALSAAKHQAGYRADKVMKAARAFFPLAIYQIDDGTMEDAVGFGDGTQNFEAIAFNQFDVIPGSDMITSVEIAWGTPAFPDPSLNGEPVTIGVWSDPNGDGNPSDAALLGSVAGTIQDAGTDTFVTYTFATPVDVSAFTSFFVGDMTPAHPGFEQFIQGIDEDSTLHRQSWIAAMSSGAPVDFDMPGNNDFIGLIDDFGIPGNWGIRANAGSGTGGITLTATVRRVNGNRLVALSWSPANGGDINILRDGVVIHTTDDDGRAQDRVGTGQREEHTYQVCETDTGTCSNEVTVKIPGSGQ